MKALSRINLTAAIPVCWQTSAETWTYRQIAVAGVVSAEASGLDDKGEVAGTYQTLAGHNDGGEALYQSHGFIDDHGIITTIDVPGRIIPA